MIKKFLICFLLNSATMLFGQWEPDQRITNDPSVSQTSPNSGWCVAAQNDTVHIVWFDYREGGDKIYYCRSTNGGLSWGPETKIVDTAAFYPQSPVVSLAVSPPRNIHIVWCDYIRGGDDEIFYKRSTDGGTTWRPDTQLTRDDLRVEADSWASIATSGQFIHVVWHDLKWDGVRYNWDIFYKRSTNGGTNWEPDQRLTTDPGGSGPPSVAATGSYVHIVWYDLRDGNPEIYYKRSTDNGSTWGADIRLTNDGANSYLPTIGANGSSVHIAWFDERDGDREIYYKRSTDAGSTWGSDTRLTNSPGESNRPSIAVSGQNLHLVWYDQRDGNYEIYYKRSTNNGTIWSPDTGLTADGAASFYPSIAISGSKLHTVWTDERDGNREIYYKRNPTGNTGIEEKEIRSQKLEARLQVTPNPFAHFATAIGWEREYFDIYDITGKWVGKDPGYMIGRDLTAGVYFIEGVSTHQLLRIVKIR
ncbi:MAG: sialidase family protein [candidate division WOR-3 bacterium]